MKNSIFNAVCKTRYLALLVVLIFTCGNAWGTATLTGKVVYSCTPVSVATASTYNNYSGDVARNAVTDLTATAHWEINCCSNNGRMGANSTNSAKMKLSQGSYSWASAIATAIGKGTTDTYVDAAVCTTALSNVGKFAFSGGSSTPSNMWLCYSTDDWKTATAIALTVGTTGNVTFDATISSAKYAFVFYHTAVTFVTPTFTFYEGETAPATAHTVTYMDDLSSDTETSVGGGITLPDRVGCTDYVFEGWTASWTEEQDEWTTTAPTILPTDETYYPTSDVNLYPVYSQVVQGAGFERYEKVTSAPSIWTGQYLITGTVSTTTYTANGTITDNRLKTATLTPSTTEYASYEITLTRIGETSNYYLQLSDGTYLGSSASNSTDFTTSAQTPNTNNFKWSISPSSIQNVSNSTRYIKLKNDNTYDFRCYTSSNGNAPSLWRRVEEEDSKKYISVPNCCTAPGLAYGTASVTKTYGDPAFINTLTNSHSVAVTYALSNVSPAGCVSINASTGQVTINGAGSATITASSAAQTISSTSYCADEASYTLTVNKANITPTLTYSPASVAVGENSNTPTVGGNSGNGTVTYSSSNPSMAAVDPSTGVVTGVAVGSVTITATIASTTNYNGNTATATVTITAAANFPNNKTIFIQAHSTSAWTGGGCVKAWFHTAGGSEAAQTTYWLFDAGSPDEGKKLFAAIVPSTGNLPYLDIQRFASNCNDWWNKNGGCSYADANGSNAIRSTGKHDDSSDGDYIRWNNDAVTLGLRGDPDWNNDLATFADQGNGVWTATYNNYAPADAADESQEFKICTNYNGWIGNSGSNNNVTVDGMHVGSTYNIGATLDVKDHSLVMTKTPVNYQVHFDMNDHGSAISSYTTVTPNSTISAPSDPSESGWTFGGWYTDDACTTGNEWDFANDPVTETMTLHAKWTRTPIIKLNDATVNITVAFGDKAVDATTGYTLSFTVSGLYLTENIAIGKSGTDQAMFTVSPSTVTQSEGTAVSTTINVTYKPSTTGSHSATLTLSSAGAVNRTVTLSGTAKWKVVWNTNGGEYITTLVDNNTKPTFPDPAPTSCESGDGASTTFIGWTKQKWTGKKNQAYIDALTGNDVVHVANTTMANVTDNTTEYHAVYALASGSGSATYKKVTSGLSDYSGQYLIVFETDNICFDGSRSTGQSNTNLDASGNFRSVEISTTSNPYSIASTSTIDTHSFTISASQTSGKYYIQSASGYYIGSTNADDTGSNELLISTSTTYDNSISVSSGNATITGVNNILKCFKQSGQSDRFRYFKTTAGNVNPIQLYKYDPGITYSNYMTTCCENKVTLNSGSPSNGTVAFSPTGPIATCSSTASERQTTVTVTPNTGYKLTGWTKAVSGIALPDSTSAISTSSGNTAAQSNTYTFAQNANGSMSVTATFSPILVSSLKLKATQTGESDKIGDDLTMNCYPKEGQTGGNDPLNHSLNVKFHEVLPADALDKTYTWSVRVKASGAADWTNVDFTGNQLNTNAIINYYNNNTGLLKIGTNEGTAEIKITANDASGVSAKVTITVAKVSVTSISVDPTSMDVYAGQKKPVTITFTPLNASDKAYTTGSYSYVTIRSSGSNPFYIEGNATEVVRNETVTVTSDDGSKTATVAVTVNPLPKATFVDIVQNKTDFVGVPSTGILSSTVDEGGLTVTTTKNTPTHADVAKPATGNNCEKEHLHLVGWILKDWADENPDATSAQIAAAGAGYFYTAGAEIDLVAKDGKTFYAVWAKEVTTP